MNENLTGVDKRQHVRVALRIPCRLTIDNIVYTAITGNISLGGVYLESMDPRLTQEALSQTGNIVICDNDSEIINTICRIVYVGGKTPYPGGVGVTFESMDDPMLAGLRKFLVDSVKK